MAMFLFAFPILACGPSPSVEATISPMPPSDFGRAYGPLDGRTVVALSEALALKPLDSPSPVAKVGFLASDNIFVATYVEPGVVIGWNATTSEVAFNHDLGIVTAKGLAFVSSARYLIGATERVFKTNRFKYTTEYIDAIALWDVTMGELIKCITYPCQGNESVGDGFLGITVAPDGTWLAISSEGGLSLSGFLNDTPNIHYTINDPDALYQWRLGNVAFDSRHRRYALVFQEGRIYLSDGEFSTQYRVMANGNEGHGLPVTDAQIDPTGQWLVITRGDTTSIWGLEAGEVHFDISTSNPVITFDKDGKMLFLGDNDKLTIYDLEAKSQLAEYEMPGITSLSISEDNRLVIIGDDLGQIHVWGKALP
jgi:WD40 repeat protein